MWRFIGSRVLQAIPVLLVVITATFFLVRIAPGGPFASEKAVIPEVQGSARGAVRPQPAAVAAIHGLSR